MSDQLTGSRAALVAALQAKQDPKLTLMIQRAGNGYYHELLSPLATPLHVLSADLAAAGYPDLVALAMQGAFDATIEEVTAFWNSPEFQAMIADLTQNIEGKVQ